MARVERGHWWYRALHQLVLAQICTSFSDSDITIIDAGCGTGGLMLFLLQRGYTALKGFDISAYAVELCHHQHGLDVTQDSLQNIAHLYPSASADVVISNDTLYFRDEQERVDFVCQCYHVLKTCGLLILNLPAPHFFRGIHDLSVGIKHRFSRSDVHNLFYPSRFKINTVLYWPFFLSPLIYLRRLAQRIKMKINPGFEIRSDVDLTSPWLNRLFTGITLFENRWLCVRPFASSLFLVMRKRRPANKEPLIVEV